MSAICDECGAGMDFVRDGQAFCIACENKQLREALQTIADGEPNADHGAHCLRWRRLARAVLKEYRP